MNKLFFHVYSDNPDSTVKQFLSDSVPVLLSITKRHTGQWTMYPNTNAKISLPVEKVYTYVFQKHPFIDAPIRQGEFKVYTQVFSGEINHNAVDIKDIKVVLSFERLEDAIKLFDKLRTDFAGLGWEQIYHEDESQRFSEIYSHESFYAVPCRIRFLLSTKSDAHSLFNMSTCCAIESSAHV